MDNPKEAASEHGKRVEAAIDQLCKAVKRNARDCGAAIRVAKDDIRKLTICARPAPAPADLVALVARSKATACHQADWPEHPINIVADLAKLATSAPVDQMTDDEIAQHTARLRKAVEGTEHEMKPNQEIAQQLLDEVVVACGSLGLLHSQVPEHVADLKRQLDELNAIWPISIGVVEGIIVLDTPEDVQQCIMRIARERAEARTSAPVAVQVPEEWVAWARKTVDADGAIGKSLPSVHEDADIAKSILAASASEPAPELNELTVYDKEGGPGWSFEWEYSNNDYPDWFTVCSSRDEGDVRRKYVPEPAPEPKSKPSAGLLQAAEAVCAYYADNTNMDCLPALNKRLEALRAAIAAEAERGAEDPCGDCPVAVRRRARAAAERGEDELPRTGPVDEEVANMCEWLKYVPESFDDVADKLLTVRDAVLAVRRELARGGAK